MGFDIRFITPFNKIVSGASQSGKTTYVKNLLMLKDHLFLTPPEKVFLFYKVKQNIYNEMVRDGLVHELVDVSAAFPTLDDIYKMIEPFKVTSSCMIWDDCLSDITPDFQQMFCNASHHFNCSIIFLTQNLFISNKNYRTMSLNAHYLTIMRNPRDKQQIAVLGKQFCPGNAEFITESYIDATKQPYSYIILDFSQQSPNAIKVRSRIFPHQFPVTVYLEK